MELPHILTDQIDDPIDVLKEVTTKKKAKFFKAINERAENDRLQDVYRRIDIPHAIGDRWLCKHRQLGSSDTRRTGKYHSGRPFKLSDLMLNFFLSPTQNLIQNRPLLVQIQYHNINYTERTLKRAL